MTEAALGVLLRILSTENDTQHNLFIWRVRELMEDQSCHAFLDAYSAAIEASSAATDSSGARRKSAASREHQKWLPFLQSYFAPDSLIDELGRSMDDMARSGKHHAAFLRVVAFGRRRHTYKGIYWLDHWSRQAKSAGLRARAEAALEAAAAAQHISKDGLVDMVVPTLGMNMDGFRSFRTPSQLVDVRINPDCSGKIAMSDHDGKPLKLQPKRTLEEDPIEYNMFKDQLASFKKEFRQVWRATCDRLERNMRDQCAYDSHRWRSLFFGHPIFFFIGRRTIFCQDNRTFTVVNVGVLSDARGMCSYSHKRWTRLCTTHAPLPDPHGSKPARHPPLPHLDRMAHSHSALHDPTY